MIIPVIKFNVHSPNETGGFDTTPVREYIFIVQRHHRQRDLKSVVYSVYLVPM